VEIRVSSTICCKKEVYFLHIEIYWTTHWKSINLKHKRLFLNFQFCSIGLYSKSGIEGIPVHSFDYFSFVASFEVEKHEYSTLAFFFLKIFASSGHIP
jgi:hypothetical protein